MTALYHATRPELLPSIIREGLRSSSGYSHFGSKQTGISTTTDLSVVSRGNFGNLILEFDRDELGNRYSLLAYQHPFASDEAEIRVIDEDATETAIPFSLVTAIYRIVPGMSRHEANSLQQLGVTVPVYILWGGKIVGRISR